MRKTKIKVDKPIIFMDTAYNKLIWVVKVTDEQLIGWTYDEDEHTIENGSWDKQSWEKFIKTEKMGRFLKLGDTNIPSKNEQDIIRELFK